ncbi:MAG: DUF4112 domain-containing protein [Gammaproteobacteria bacterium]|nr:DUF4112 domain-containing protein [Gammaproteobacteria bacterium]
MTRDAPGHPDDAARIRARLSRLAWLLDSSVRLPGGFRIGIDGLIGLIPGIGDLVAASVSAYIVAEAARLEVPGHVILRMISNVLVDLLVGTIPVLGDAFDFAFKANRRNIDLLDSHLDGAAATAGRGDDPSSH